MESFLQCPCKYDLEYNQKIKGEEGEALRFGSLVHKICEMYVKNLRNTGRTRDPAYLNENIGGLFERDSIADKEQQYRAREMLSYFLAKDIDPVKVMEIELLEGEAFEKIPDSKLWFRFDRVDAPDDKSIVIIDYKTGRMMPKLEELESSIAFAAYSWGMRKTYPTRENFRMEWFFLDPSKTVTLEAMSIERAEAMIEPIARRMLEATEYPPAKNHNCKYCDYPKMGHCAIGPKPRVAKKEAVDAPPADTKTGS
jgi:RecB family exonuclease